MSAQTYAPLVLIIGVLAAYAIARALTIGTRRTGQGRKEYTSSILRRSRRARSINLYHGAQEPRK